MGGGGGNSSNRRQNNISPNMYNRSNNHMCADNYAGVRPHVQKKVW